MRIGRMIETNPKLDATEAREHLLWLQAQGVGIKRVAAESGMGTTQIYRIRSGKAPVILASTALKILSVGTHRFDPKELAYNGAAQRAKNWLKKTHDRESGDASWESASDAGESVPNESYESTA
jgi:hypothetical protein